MNIYLNLMSIIDDYINGKKSLKYLIAQLDASVEYIENDKNRSEIENISFEIEQINAFIIENKKIDDNSKLEINKNLVKLKKILYLEHLPFS